MGNWEEMKFMTEKLYRKLQTIKENLIWWVTQWRRKNYVEKMQGVSLNERSKNERNVA